MNIVSVLVTSKHFWSGSDYVYIVSVLNTDLLGDSLDKVVADVNVESTLSVDYSIDC